ncbi:hypothetical protein [Nocardia vulneris]|uniref:Uncharacterized protein n=1 Tax=Nocardia vulneris TaxID=1141657 RepID=A0ABR4ZF28_9NOCA|nr:hypothetical protein [Nocardia vulneris]KIA63856.1 hypothetical protein FG87_17330 [Nocardia vulneris]
MAFNWWRDAETDGLSVQEIVDRVQAEWRTEHATSRTEQSKPADSDVRLISWPHQAPDYIMGTPEAHVTMQRHRGCRAEECPRKAAAQQALIAAGRMVPDTSRQR